LDAAQRSGVAAEKLLIQAKITGEKEAALYTKAYEKAPKKEKSLLAVGGKEKSSSPSSVSSSK
jgi:hypothetical protein